MFIVANRKIVAKGFSSVPEALTEHLKIKPSERMLELMSTNMARNNFCSITIQGIRYLIYPDKYLNDFKES